MRVTTFFSFPSHPLIKQGKMEKMKKTRQKDMRSKQEGRGVKKKKNEGEKRQCGWKDGINAGRME